MGCVESAPGKNKPKRAGSPNGGARGKRLLEEYSIGTTLGEGAFGVVSNCTHRATGVQYAVKMVDKVETPVEAIKKEAETLQRLNHPNIVKVHGVFFERCFVCIVMDKYSGGDLVEGLQHHLKERGQIKCQDIAHVAKQMGASIQHLHSENIVHRDIKGDNYLMSCRDVTDPECRIALADFGTAAEIKPGERLSAGVGTKIFWPPECFVEKNYGPKVDVWAMGVIMYGLVTGRFPFKDERDIRNKEVKIPKRVAPVCEDFIRRMLEKSEGKRLDSNAVMAHAWLAQRERHSQASADVKDDDHGTGHELREALVNDGIKERRQELISRLNLENVVRGQSQGSTAPKRTMHHLQSSFVLPDKAIDGAKFTYQWWNKEEVAKSGLLDLEKKARPLEHHLEDAGGQETLRRLLLEHHIDPDLFGVGKAKTLRALAAELQTGACRMMLDATEHKKLVRVVDVVVMRIFASTGGGQPRLLIESEERYPDNRTRVTLRLPGTKKEPYENSKQTAERILQDTMKLPRSVVSLDLQSIVRYEEETESPSYPGVSTVYRKEIVEGVFSTEDQAVLAQVGLPRFSSWEATDQAGYTKTLEWMTEDEAQEKGVKLKAEGAEVVSTLVRAPIGLEEEALTKELKELGLDVSKYGQPDKTISIKELSSQLIRGEASLRRSPTGQALRVVDVVVLIVRNPFDGTLLVQTEHELPDGSRSTMNRLPGSKCRPDENHFLSARRTLRRSLEVDDNLVRLVKDVRLVEEEAASLERRQWDLSYYGGLKTVYRKRLIEAELDTVELT